MGTIWREAAGGGRWTVNSRQTAGQLSKFPERDGIGRPDGQENWREFAVGTSDTKLGIDYGSNLSSEDTSTQSMKPK